MKMTFRQKIEFLRTHVGMFPIESGNIDSAIAFVAGMDFAADGRLAEHFAQWLRTRHTLSDHPFWWGKLVIFAMEAKSIETEHQLDFLISEILIHLSQSSCSGG